MAQPTLLLKGSFDSFSIDDVLDVVGLSRQTMRVVLDDSGRGGEFLVKAGRVIQAAAPPVEGRRAFVNIYREPGQGFAVWQHVEATGEPIGLLADLISEAKALEKEPAAPSRTPILAGSFADHRLDEVLDVLNMTRQLVEFKVMREDETRVWMILKAGQVLACEDERQSTSGLSAFRTLFADPGTHFEVVRLLTPPDDLPAPIGRLPALVQQALKEDDQASKKRAGVLFQGAFQNFPLSDVLEALSVTRLTVEMVFHDADGTRGTFVLKAGQVLAAQALRTGSSGREAFLELMADPGESFVVVRRPGTPASDPIGQLRDLLAEARNRKKPTTGVMTRPAPQTSSSTATPPPPPSTRPTVVAPVQVTTGKGRGPVTRARTPVKSVPPPVPATMVPNATAKLTPKANPVPSIAAAKAAASTAKGTPPSIEVVLDGAFDNFAIDDVLQVLSISRQYVALGTLRNGVPLARLVVKSGRLLMASYGSVKDPVQAMAMLLEDPGTEFRVRRLPRYADSDLGGLAEIVQQARRSKPPATLIHLPRPTPAPEPEPEVDTIDLDDLFDEEVPPPPKPKPKPEPIVEARAKARAKAKTKAKLEAKPKTEPKVAPPSSTAKVDLDDLFPNEAPAPAIKAKVEPKPKVVEAKPEPKAKARVEVKPKTRPEPRIETKPKAKVEPKPEPKVEAKAEPKVEAKAEPKAEPKVEAKAEAKAEPKVEAKAEPKVEAKAEPEPEPKVEAKAVEVAAQAAAAKPEDAVAQSLALIEERLRGQTEVVRNDEAVDALKSLTSHLETMARSMEVMNSRVELMVKETNKMTSKQKEGRVLMIGLGLVACVAAVLAGVALLS